MFMVMMGLGHLVVGMNGGVYFLLACYKSGQLHTSIYDGK